MVYARLLKNCFDCWIICKKKKTIKVLLECHNCPISSCFKLLYEKQILIQSAAIPQKMHKINHHKLLTCCFIPCKIQIEPKEIWRWINPLPFPPMLMFDHPHPNLAKTKLKTIMSMRWGKGLVNNFKWNLPKSPHSLKLLSSDIWTGIIHFKAIPKSNGLMKFIYMEACLKHLLHDRIHALS